MEKIFAFYLHRLEGLYKYIHNGISVLSLAETKMKKELEEIETFLKFHKESLQQVRIFMSDQVVDYYNHNIFCNVMLVMIQLVTILQCIIMLTSLTLPQAVQVNSH